MKKIFSYLPLGFAALMILFTACEEKERAFPEFGEVETGAIARLVEGINGEFDFEDIDNSQLDFTVEFFDANNGNDVASYSFAVNYAGQGPVAIKSYDASQFTKNDDGLPQLDVTLTFREILDALGLQQSGIVPGQAFDIQATITMNDGRTFDSANTAPNVQGQPLFQSVMAIRQGVINVPCFSILEGEFEATATAIDPEPENDIWECDGNQWMGMVRFTAEHDPTEFGTGTYFIESLNDNDEWVHDNSMGGYYTCYTGSLTNPAALPNNIDDQGMLRLNEDCGSLFWTGTSQWGETYTIEEVTVNGLDLTIVWQNDYGESASVKLTRTDGMEWPTDLIDGDG